MQKFAFQQRRHQNKIETIEGKTFFLLYCHSLVLYEVAFTWSNLILQNLLQITGLGQPNTVGSHAARALVTDSQAQWAVCTVGIGQPDTVRSHAQWALGGLALRALGSKAQWAAMYNGHWAARHNEQLCTMGTGQPGTMSSYVQWALGSQAQWAVCTVGSHSSLTQFSITNRNTTFKWTESDMLSL